MVMKPVITVSREIGTRGEVIAQQLADAMHLRYFDKKLLGEQARKLGISIYEAEACAITEDDYRVRGVINSIMGNSKLVTVIESTKGESLPSQRSRTLDEETCLTIEGSIIQELGKDGSIVIVGRGSQVLLRDQPGVLHVKIVASHEFRVKTIMKDRNLNSEEAQKIVKYRDTATREYLKRVYHVDWDENSYYDMLLNIERITASAAVAGIANSAREMTVH